MNLCVEWMVVDRTIITIKLYDVTALVAIFLETKLKFHETWVPFGQLHVTILQDGQVECIWLGMQLLSTAVIYIAY